MTEQNREKQGDGLSRREILRAGAYMGLASLLSPLSGCITTTTPEESAANVLFRREANKLDFPLTAAYVEGLVQINEASNKEAKRTLYPGFDDRAKTLLDKIKDDKVKKVTLNIGGFTPYGERQEGFNFNLNIETGNLSYKVLSSHLPANPVEGTAYMASATVLWDEDRAWPNDKRKAGAQPLLVVDYRHHSNTNQHLPELRIPIQVRREIPLTDWKLNLAGLLVGYLRAENTDAVEVYQNINPFSPNDVSSLMAMTETSLGNVLRGKTPTQKTTDNAHLGEHYQGGICYGLEGGDHVRYISRDQKADLTFEVAGHDRACQVKFAVLKSGEEKNRTTYGVVTDPIPLTDNPNGPKFNGDYHTLIKEEVADDVVKSITYYPLRDGQKCFEEVKKIVGDYDKTLADKDK